MVGILYICTGKYHIFWKEFFISAERYFLPAQRLTYFVFTDAKEIYEETNPKVKKIYQKSLGWPYNTLFRFEIFSRVITQLHDCDYLYGFNANIKFIDFITDEILPDEENNGLIAVLDPVFYNIAVDRTAYERNAQSTAYVGYGHGNHYYSGAFSGGMTSAYLKLIIVLKENIRTDLSNGIIADWWDESHLNKYLADRSPLALDTSYLYPEGFDLSPGPKTLLLDPVKFGGYKYLRGDIT